MPLNPSAGLTVPGPVSATEINNNIGYIESYLGGGIVSGDYKTTSRWVKSKHIDPADFRGSPSPRWEAVSGAIHRRYTNNRRESAALFADDVAGYSSGGETPPEAWQVIHGLASRVRVHPQVSRVVGLEVKACWWAFESDGRITYSPSTIETAECAQFALFIDGVKQTGTMRRLYRGTVDGKIYTRKMHSIVFYKPDIGDGVHDVSVRVRVTKSSLQTSPKYRNHKWIWVRTRALKAQVQYL